MQSLRRSTSEVKVNIIHGGRRHYRIRHQPGAGLKAVVIGFNTRADAGAERRPKEPGVDIRYYNIIYDAVG